MSVWETLGELLGKAFKSVTDSLLGLLKFKPAQLEDVNTEIAGASLDPEKFRTTEVKDLAKAIKESLSHSPEGLADWTQSIMGNFMTKIWDVALSIMLPAKMDTFEEAKASAAWLGNLFADFIVLSAVLDMVGTALSATLVRNLIHIFRLFAATFGMDRYLDACIAPALTASIVPRLTQGYNAQYQTLIPGVSDIIRMAVREAFTPEIAEKFGQYEDFPEETVPFLAQTGLTRDWAERYWAAHWGLPSASDGFELLHRGILTEDELKLLLRANDIMPFWRDQLIKLSWNIPTRVDVRRFWDMRTIDEKRLREIYTGLGYHAQDLEDYVLWTKIFVDFPDLLARYKNGWITLDQVKSELVAMGMKPERADTLIEEKVKKAAPERVAKERDLTAAEIIKGIKKGIITDYEGAELLQDMGYDANEAWFKIAIEITAAAGSPETFEEFKDLTQKYRLAAGMEGKPMAEELKKAAAKVVRLTKEVESLQRSIEEEERGLVEAEVLPVETTARLTELQVSLHRAEAELARVKSEYGRLVAEWKFKVG